jgi:hypothetical protein
MLPAEVPLALINSAFLQKHPRSIHAIFAAAKASALVNPGEQVFDGLLMAALGEESFTFDMKVNVLICQQLYD